MKKEGIIYDAGKGWYSFLERSYELNIDPVKDIVKILRDIMPLLPFSCWSTEQLNSFTHHIMAKFVIFIYTDSDYMRNAASSLRDKGYNVYENPLKTEIKKQFEIGDRTVVIRPAISKQPTAEENISPVEKVLVDFLIENQKLSIMETSEAENAVVKAINSGRINISELYSYSNRRKLEIAHIINQVQYDINVEIID